MTWTRRTLLTAALTVPALALTACSTSDDAPSTASGTPGAPASSARATTPGETASSATPSSSPSPSPSSPVGDLTLAQQVGQLFMVGVATSDPGDASYAAVRDEHVGNVFLAGRSDASTAAVADLVASFTDLVSPTTTGGLPMFVATDQEGGLVQVLRGPGFSTIPSATRQSDLSPAELETDAGTWGTELSRAGINLNLAPVMDVVPEGTAKQNPPIGVFGRQYGSTASDVARSANAFSAGMESAGVDVAIKHFPGLGLVDANTDTDAHVVDGTTDAASPSIDAFRSGIDAGAAFVMMATAVYPRLDPDAPAAFSAPIVTDLLRDELGFDGVCITDDVSAAVQVEDVDPGERAVRTIAAGCDMVLASASPELVPQMVDAVVARAKTDPAFADQVEAAAARVLAAKERLG